MNRLLGCIISEPVFHDYLCRMNRMINRTSTEEPPVKGKPSVDLEVLYMIHPELWTESHVYVHCHFDNRFKDMLLRVWRSTFLVDKASAYKSALVHAENITYAPQWTLIPDNTTYSFLLIFEALPKGCTLFDLVEEIPQPGGFFIADIQRNTRDVYHVWI
jgi:hypothetical protein